MSYIDNKDIFDATDGGLNVILSYYPDAEKCLRDRNHQFKIRQYEKTPSATLIKAEDGIYKVIDYGDDQKPRNAIDVVMYEENLKYGEACRHIAQKFGIKNSKGVMEAARSGYKKAPATEPDGSFSLQRKDKPSKEDLAVLGPYVTAEQCAYLGFIALDSYTTTKGGETHTISSNPEYPIFAIRGNYNEDGEDIEFFKIYQPKAADKKYRFSYLGKKPKDHIFGLNQAQAAHQDLINDTPKEETDPKYVKNPRLDRIFICGGDRDSINCHSLDADNHVIWRNSESAVLTNELMRQLQKMAFNIINIPDIDLTGVRVGRKLALDHLEMKTLWLPTRITDKKDWRGNACKDLTDYVRITPEKGLRREFREMVKAAPAAKFWREYKTKEGTTKYDFHNVQAYYFLELNGFHRFENKNKKDGYVFIRVVGNIVEEIETNKIEDFIHDFLESRRMPHDLRNFIYNTTKFNDRSINRIKYRHINFEDYGKEYQWLFFQNKTWEITAKGITEYRPTDVSRYVWDDEVIKHNVTVAEKLPFTFTRRADVESGTITYDITVNNGECMFLNYLIQTSRIYWREELEERVLTLAEPARAKYLADHKFDIAGPLLHPDEIYEQKVHLINKLYALGYLMHRYKDPSKAWCVFAMDNKIAGEGESHGGSGKSICFKSLTMLMKYDIHNGRNKRLTENPHMFEQVNEHTDYILIDECDRYFNFGFFFSSITGDLQVNPKNNKQYTIPFKLAPKFCITSNYTLFNLDASTERRLLYTVFSDYYHYNRNGEYKESRSPRDDFGKALFDDFTEAEWNAFFNTAAAALQLYLAVNEKIDPPMTNVRKRNLISEMGELFKNWADVYFHGSAEEDKQQQIPNMPKSRKLDVEIMKKDAYEAFIESSGAGKTWNSNRFTKSIKAWAQYWSYVYNPKDKCNTDDRIVHWRDGKTHEFFYIGTSIGPAAPEELPEF